jgi:hypothetical protein
MEVGAAPRPTFGTSHKAEAPGGNLAVPPRDAQIV